jgi:hypothetical protein
MARNTKREIICELKLKNKHKMRGPQISDSIFIPRSKIHGIMTDTFNSYSENAFVIPPRITVDCAEHSVP